MPIMAQSTITPRAPGRTSSRKTSGTILRRLKRGVGACLLVTVALILVLRVVPVPTSAFMLIRHVERIFEPNPGPRLLYFWTPAARIPKSLALAAVAAEDQNFFRHFGFDLEAISQALEYNERHKKIRGASTISQQVAKNLFLWPSRNIVRKGLETGLTVLLELLWPKKRILEVYLNIAEFGDGTYGVGAAAKRFFGKKPENLTWRQAALLAASLPSPRRARPWHPSVALSRRADRIQEQMRHLGLGSLDWKTKNP